MKRTRKPLHLDAQTIRALGGASLERAAGASDDNDDPRVTRRPHITCGGSACLIMTDQCV